MFGCLFSLSLKCCFTVPIYDNRPLNVYRNNGTVTRRAESQFLLQPVAFSQALLFDLLWLFTRRRRVMATCRLVDTGWRGLWVWWSRAREGCQMLQKLMTEKRKWQIHNFLYWHRSSGGKTQLWCSRLDYGHHVVTPVALLPQCGETTVIYGENATFVQSSRALVMVYIHF